MSEATSSNDNEGVPATLLYDQETHISSAIRCGLVTDFIDHIEWSCDRALRKQSTDLEKFISSLKGKLKSFTAAFGTAFDQYVESCNSSQSEQDQHLFVLLEELFSTSLCSDLYSTLAPIVPLAMVVAPSPATVESLVWRLKHPPRNRRVPERLLDFKHGLPQSEYVLTEQDKEILEGFHRNYTTKYQPSIVFSAQSLQLLDSNPKNLCSARRMSFVLFVHWLTVTLLMLCWTQIHC
ncbi:hypothetical protein MRB53_009208 [Persea americana]|uniref:Uncharacterized protein n=1 Tax=Persea americana TaxID=3435 RepID=A0ACC2LPJ2_PERAE|nr:hypothetical protein MRB53_009208 [Persea americana]